MLKHEKKEKRILSSFNLAVLISGSGTNLQAIIDATENGTIPNAKVALVISSRDGAFGLERAKNHNIPNMVIGRQEPEKLANTLKEHKTDGIVLAGYLSMIPPDVIKTYTGKIINIHPALLPLFGGKGFYGIRVHQAVLASGVKYTGATAHLADQEYDTGAAFIRSVVPILPDDTPEELQKRVLKEEHKILVQATKALSENQIDELIKNPITYTNEEDQDGIHEFANDLLTLGTTLAKTGKI